MKYSKEYVRSGNRIFVDNSNQMLFRDWPGEWKTKATQEDRIYFMAVVTEKRKLSLTFRNTRLMEK